MPLSSYEKKNNYGSHEKTSSKETGREKSANCKENSWEDSGQNSGEESGKTGGFHYEEDRFRKWVVRTDGHDRRIQSRGDDTSARYIRCESK